MSIDDVLNNEYNNYNVIKAMEDSVKEKRITIFRGEYFFLSNFYNSSILFKGQVYQNAESAFQSCKCDDKVDRMRFVGISGKEAKRLGRRVKLREDWEEIKDKIMYEVVKSKFQQNTYLKQQLLKTQDIEICEENYWHDNYYGNCICNKCKIIEGENKLGEILMKVREELR